MEKQNNTPLQTSKSGVTSAFLAKNGAQTPSDMIEGELGFLKGYKNNIDYSKN